MSGIYLKAVGERRMEDGNLDETGLQGADNCWCMEVHNTIMPTFT